jgi:poly(3-hydroxybutyrate) depolymerase/sugar lactone lactonase YvrE
MFHGYGGSASGAASVGLRSAWPEATVVYAQGLIYSLPIGVSGGNGWQVFPGEFQDRDLRYVETLIQDLSATYKVDDRRIYATGISNGAMFCYLLLATRPERFAAVAPVATVSVSCLRWSRGPRPVLITQGKQDGLALAEWGRNQLLRANGCEPKGSEWAPGAVSYDVCASGQPVILSVHAGGHEWGSQTTANIVRFFKAHSLPAPPPALAAATEPDRSGTVVGTGKSGFTGDGGSAMDAQLSFPEGVALDSAGNFFVADTRNQRIRRIDRDGIITTVAGSAGHGYDGFKRTDRALQARFFDPEGIVLDGSGNLYIADTFDHLVRKVTPDGLITTVAGTEADDYSKIRFSGDGGPGSKARLAFPTGVAVDSLGSLFIADSENHRVRRVGPDGIIQTVAGTGVAGSAGDGGAAAQAQLNTPWGLALDSQGNLFISDSGNHRVRKLTPDGTITTVAGTGSRGFNGDGGAAIEAQLNQPLGVAVDSQGTLFVVDSLNHRVRRVGLDGVISTVFGGEAESDIGSGSAPRYYPSSVAIDRAGNLLIADPFNQRIWQVSAAAAPGLVAGLTFPDTF